MDTQLRFLFPNRFDCIFNKYWKCLTTKMNISESLACITNMSRHLMILKCYHFLLQGLLLL